MQTYNNARTEYSEVSRAQVTDTRSVVFSKCSRGGYTIAQRLETQEGDITTSVFLKGAIHVNDLEGLYNLRDALNELIEEGEKEFSETIEQFGADDWSEND